MKKLILLLIVVALVLSNCTIVFSERMSTYENLKNIEDNFIKRLVAVGASETDVENFLDDMDEIVSSYKENIYINDIDAFFIAVFLQCLSYEENISVLVAFDMACQTEIEYMNRTKKVPASMTNFKLTVFADKLIVESPGHSDEEFYVDPEEEIPNVSEPIVPEVQLPFDDIKDVSWCVESVVYLHEHDVVSGTGNRMFEPNRIITREEFLKMIVCATLEINGYYFNEFGLDGLGTWYHPYLAMAEFYSLLQGIYEEDYFAPGVVITRQDMATIAYRAAKRAKINLPDIKPSTDFMDVKDMNYYSVEAVKELQEAGVISGTGDNLFSPDKPTTRAEAARIIYNIMKFIPVDK